MTRISFGVVVIHSVGQNTGREVHGRLIRDWINRHGVKIRTAGISKTGSCLARSECSKYTVQGLNTQAADLKERGLRGR